MKKYLLFKNDISTGKMFFTSQPSVNLRETLQLASDENLVDITFLNLPITDLQNLQLDKANNNLLLNNTEVMNNVAII